MSKTAKKILLSVFVVLMVFTCALLCGKNGVDLKLTDINITAFAYGEEQTSGKYTYTVLNGKTTIIDVDDSISGNVTIPSKLGGYSVTAIDEDAFQGCFAIKSVTIPNTVTVIGDNAFSSCTKLSSITLPDTITSIGEDAFLDTAYYNKTANWTKGVLYIGKYLIKAKDTLSGSYSIKKGTKTIADYAFYECEDITAITIPDTVTHIGVQSFYDCESIKSITIPASVKSIGAYAFACCFDLVTIKIPDTISHIGRDAFIYTEHYDKTSNWSNNAYYVGNHLADINSDKISGAYTVKNGTKVIADRVFGYNDKITRIIIPDSVTVIGEYAFDSCANLTSVTIGNSVTTIGNGAFEWCNALSTVTVGSAVTSIGDYAFYYCKSLKSIKIPDAVTSIGYGCFANCEKLATATIGCSVKKIGDQAFYYCKSLKSIAIPAATTGIGYGCFADCESLATATIGSAVTKIGDYAFYYCKSLKNIKIPDSVTTIGDYAFDRCEGLTTATIGKSVTKIGDCAFYYCKSLKSIIIPDSVTSLGSYAFYSCISLTSATIGNSVKSVPDHAFAYCDRLKSVIIGNSVTSLGDYAFAATSVLTDMIIPASLKTVGEYALYCYKLANIYYTGTQAQWKKIKIHENNKYYLGDVKISYNYQLPKYTYTLSKTSYTYNGSVKTPTVTVKDQNGKVLKKGTDYTVKYADGRKVPGTYTVVVTAKGTFPYTKTLTFKINPINISTCTVKLSATSYTFNGKVKTPTVTVTNASGTKLTKDTHYTVSYIGARKDAGTYKVIVKMKGNYTGTKTLSFKINPIKISTCDVKLSATSYTYDGKVKAPTVTVTNASGAKLTKGTSYTVSYASGRKNVGTYKVTVTMKGNYTGTKKLTFKINPPKTTVASLVAGKKAITVNITKKTTQTTGYQIQYATNKNFTNAKTVTIAKNTTVKTTLSGLSSAKTYYVRVRTFKTVNDVKYYSGWSASKYVKTK